MAEKARRSRGRVTGDGALDGFSAATRAWFDGAFAEPTQAQAGAWRAIGQWRGHAGRRPDWFGQDAGRVLVGGRPAGRHAAARRSQAAQPGAVHLPAEGAGGRHRAEPAGPADRDQARRAPARPGRAGHPGAVRTGDTAAEERSKLASKPPDILITTPESLFLLVTSQARETLRGVETVIVDEVHAVAGNKRGAHLALRWNGWTPSAQVGSRALASRVPALYARTASTRWWLGGAQQTGRSVGHGAAGGRGGHVPRRHAGHIVQPPSPKRSSSRSSSRSRT